MTLRDRLRIIGQALTGDPVTETVKEVIKEVEKKDKIFLGGTFDLFRDDKLSSATKVSSKVLEANKGWVYRNNDVIAKEVATIEFELFNIKIVGQEVQFNPILSHPILDALDRFNEFTAASDGFYVTQSHKKLSGDAFWYIDRSGKTINNIYILPPDKIEIKIGKIQAGQTIIDGYQFKDTINGKPVKEDYEPEEIIHFRSPNPKNYYRGLGAVEALADDIDTDWMAIEANKMIYRRGLIGSFVLQTDKSLTEEQRKQLRAEFTSSYQGLQNAFKVPIFSGGLKPEVIQMTAKDMEFIAHQEWVRDKITAGFGNNKAVIGVTDDVNRANAEATIENWKRTTVTAEMKQLTDTLNEFLVPKFGQNLLLGFKAPVAEARAEKIEEIGKLIQANVITQNEAREIIGLDPLPDADQLRESLAIPIIPKALRHININRMLRRNKIFASIEKNKQLKDITRPIARKIIKSRKKELGKYLEYWRRQIHIVEATEKIFQTKLEKFIDRLVRKAISQVPNEVANMQAKELIDDESELVQAMLDFEPLLVEVAIAAGNQAMGLINSTKPYIMKDFREKIKKRVELFAGSMIQTDKDKLINIITDGVRDGLSIPQIRSNIIDTFEIYSKTQAERITRTEVISISNQAALDAWDQSGLVSGKQWLTAGDGRVDEECDELNGKVIMDLGGNFYGLETEFDTGDPPIHVNCRCIVVPILAEKRHKGSS